MILKMTTLTLAVCVSFFITAKAGGLESQERDPNLVKKSMLSKFFSCSAESPKVVNTVEWINQLQEAFRKGGYICFLKEWNQYHISCNKQDMFEIILGERRFSPDLGKGKSEPTLGERQGSQASSYMWLAVCDPETKKTFGGTVTNLEEFQNAPFRLEQTQPQSF